MTRRFPEEVMDSLIISATSYVSDKQKILKSYLIGFNMSFDLSSSKSFKRKNKSFLDELERIN